MGQMEQGNIGMEDGEHEVSPQDNLISAEATPDQIFHGGSTLRDGYKIEARTGRIVTHEEDEFNKKHSGGNEGFRE
ncbi:MAG: hypothetical protein WAV98_00635 [Minisyncoccia bacterium]